MRQWFVVSGLLLTASAGPHPDAPARFGPEEHERYAPGPGGADIQLPQLLEQTGSRHPGQDGRQGCAKRHCRQHQVLPAATPGNGKPSELHRENDRQHRPKPEVWYRDSRQCQRHRRVIDKGAAFHGGHDAERNRDGHRDQH